MKTNFTLFFLLITIAASAQNKITPEQMHKWFHRYNKYLQPPTFGITGSINYSNYLHGQTTPLAQNQLKGGFSAGVYYKRGNRVYIKPNLTYNRHNVGTRFNPLYQGWHIWKWRTNYVQLAVPIGFKLSRTFSINAGAYAGYNVGKVGNTIFWHEKPDYLWRAGNNWQHLGVRIWNKLDYGYTAGVEADLHGLSVVANFQQGLRSVTKKSDKPGAPLQGWMNRQVSAGIEVPFKLK